MPRETEPGKGVEEEALRQPLRLRHGRPRLFCYLLFHAINEGLKSSYFYLKIVKKKKTECKARPKHMQWASFFFFNGL